MINLIQLITVQQAYDGITHAWRWASWNWWWRMVDDDDGDESPSSEPRTDSRSALPREIRAWRWLRIVKRDETFSLIFFSAKRNIWSWSWGRWSVRGPRGRGACPPPSWTGCGPPDMDFSSSIFLIFQIDVPWSFWSFREILFLHINNTMESLLKNMNWFDTTLIVVIYHSYTNGSCEGFLEFCVIEVFKFWVILRWMKEKGLAKG